MATLATHRDIRVNAKGDITVPWIAFVNVHPEDVMDVVRKKARMVVPHTIRPTTRNPGVKEFI
jgi:hypothetical protein